MYAAFQHTLLIASGSMSEISKQIASLPDRSQILVFEDSSGNSVDLVDEPAPVARSAGRPKLGVVAREVTLLPRHWEWLNSQPGGASVALRKLVEQARKANETPDRIRQSREAAYRFMNALAGNLPHFEEALRALFGGNQRGFDQLIHTWPPDIRDYALKLALESFKQEPSK